MLDSNVRLDIDVDPTIMNKVVSDIQSHADRRHGSSGGVVGDTSPPISLPERNIPTEPHIQSLLHDSASSPNYVPAVEAPRASKDASIRGRSTESAMSVLNKLRRGGKRDQTVDNLFDDFKGVILLSVVYYVFQTPYAHTLMKRVFSFGYNEDGTTNRLGVLAACITFSVFIFVINNAQNRVLELMN